MLLRHKILPPQLPRRSDKCLARKKYFPFAVFFVCAMPWHGEWEMEKGRNSPRQKAFCHKLSSTRKNCSTYILTWVGCFPPCSLNQHFPRQRRAVKMRAKHSKVFRDGSITPCTIYHYDFMIQFEIFTNYSECISRAQENRLVRDSRSLRSWNITFRCWMSTLNMEKRHLKYIASLFIKIYSFHPSCDEQLLSQL